MTQEEIIDYNKRCAEFLGMDNDAFLLAKQIEKNTGICHLKFHSDWNWIKLVLEKISSLNEDDFSVETQQSFENLLDLSLFSTQESVCESINNFLKTLL